MKLTTAISLPLLYILESFHVRSVDLLSTVKAGVSAPHEWLSLGVFAHQLDENAHSQMKNVPNIVFKALRIIPPLVQSVGAEIYRQER